MTQFDILPTLAELAQLTPEEIHARVILETTEGVVMLRSAMRGFRESGMTEMADAALPQLAFLMLQAGIIAVCPASIMEQVLKSLIEVEMQGVTVQ